MMNYGPKLLSDQLGAFKNTLAQCREDKIVHMYASNQGYLPIDPPVKACDFECPFCGSREFFRLIEQGKGAWLCGLNCRLSKLPDTRGATITPATPKRALLWPLFCEINGIGDEHYGVTFDGIDQIPKKLEFLSSFAINPRGVVIMEGDPGTGKSYAAMGLCEFYTRNNTSVMFLTQKTMTEKWLDSFREEKGHVFQRKLEDVALLVIDDFATGAPSAAFLAFFMEIINSRIQWTNKGTVITTNLSFADLSNFCGHALSDRLRVGQRLLFQGASRRKKPPL